MSKQVVFEVPRGKHEKIRITKGDFKDKVYLDIRLFFTDQKTGELKPTKKGITLPLAYLPQLTSALIQCQKTLHKDAFTPSN